MWNRLPDPIKAASFTALWSFLGTFSLTLLGWLAQVGEWASKQGAEPFPGVGVLGYAAVSALVASASFVVSALVRFAQGKGWLPGSAPTYAKR